MATENTEKSSLLALFAAQYGELLFGLYAMFNSNMEVTAGRRKHGFMDAHFG